MQLFTVNDALKQKLQLNGLRIEIEGILSYEFEDTSILHWPKAEREASKTSGIWIDTKGVFSFNDEVLQRWSGKRVVVLGVFEAAESDNYDSPAGFGHFGLFSARIIATQIDLLKSRQKDHV